MQKVVYTLEQMQELSRQLNTLTITGLEQSKKIVFMATIIDNPCEIIDIPNDELKDSLEDGEAKGE